MRPSSRLLSTTSTNTTTTTATVAASRTRKPAVSRKAAAPPLSLEQFIQRQRVLTLWRTILRSAYRIPKDLRGETLAYARGEFERNRHVSDVGQIRYLISTGKAEFDGMQRYIDELAARAGGPQ
ncbi:hypothetical protein A1O3_07624 [Capronia epimyces CBS 606.96]|uniref:LYR motif-containing protein 2 n=1 Tax=Capronia epimyces CBS 606.96 TaxID=1182542 RepID=W9YGE6_9EURO|nr:uncharacterized protein A1O3_07624 [Capronia epimyces CBS 606.96]EXJ81334.1 hypothetical protein A1O3_07624 [Capronia epimyces CBS 606.96]